VIDMVMPASNLSSSADVLIYRHSALVRVTHWVNVLCLSFLLLSGLQIFNAHPALYWGQYGADHDPSFISIGAVQNGSTLRGVIRVGSLAITTTGFFGVSHANGELPVRGFPSWLTIPSYQDFAAGRGGISSLRGSSSSMGWSTSSTAWRQAMSAAI
jgi:thiosulfate reductase cytochrome b subunit